MLSESGLSSKLVQFNQANGQPYIVYGDPAYGISRNILTPFRGAQLTAAEKDFNKSMSQVRVSVEWTFGKILQYFTYVDLKRNNKILLQPVGKYYVVAALMTNWHTCILWITNYYIFWCCSSIFRTINNFAPHAYNRYTLHIWEKWLPWLLMISWSLCKKTPSLPCGVTLLLKQTSTEIQRTLTSRGASSAKKSRPALARNSSLYLVLLKGKRASLKHLLSLLFLKKDESWSKAQENTRSLLNR